MKKYLFIAGVFLILLTSCDGVLWNGSAGEDNEGQNLTVSISNPFYQNSESNSSRALALQGKYLYIEISYIEGVFDSNGEFIYEDTYSASPSRAVSSMLNDRSVSRNITLQPVDYYLQYFQETHSDLTGRGIWYNTIWGGTAIWTIDLNNWTTDFQTIFTNIPTDKYLVARAILSDSRDNLEQFLRQNESVPAAEYPICFSDGSDFNETDYWLFLSPEDIQSGALPITMVPWAHWADRSLAGNIFLDFSLTNGTEEYIDSGSPFYTETEPEPGLTRFTDFYIDMSGEPLAEMALFLTSDFDLQEGFPLPGVISMYDINGRKIPFLEGGDFLSSPQYPVRNLQITEIYLDPNPDPIIPEDPLSTPPPYSNYTDVRFISSTRFAYDITGSPITDIMYDPLIDSIQVAYGLVFDPFPTISGTTLDWTLPTGIESGDLEFRVIVIDDGSSFTYGTADIDTIAEVEAITSLSDSGWISGLSSTITPQGFDNDWVIILARSAGSEPGDPFFFGRTFRYGMGM